VVSPWSTGQLQTIVWSDVFGDPATAPVSRGEAVSVPAVANARWLITVPLAQHPLKSYTQDLVDADQPAWLYRTNGLLSPQFRMLWTLDDLLFYGFSLWGVARGAKNQITDAWRIPYDDWQFTPDYQVSDLAGNVYGADEVILFTSPMDPLLDCAARTIRAARNIEVAWAARVKDPIPHTLIKQTEDVELDEEIGHDEDGEAYTVADEVQDLLDTYVKARQRDTGSVSFVPLGYDVEAFGEAEPQLYIEGRNAVALDVARFTALPPALLAASQTQASLTYSTQEGQRSQLADYSLIGWAMAIEARLSMDDCVPAGHSVKFDLTWDRSPAPTTTPPQED